MMEMGWRRVICALGWMVASSCGGAGANHAVEHGALEALDGDRQRVAPGGDPAVAFESRPAAARTLPPLEDRLRLRLVQGYQRAGAATGVTVVADQRLDRAMDDLARAL